MRFVSKDNIPNVLKLNYSNSKNNIKEVCLNQNLISDSIYRDPYSHEDGNESKVADELAKYYYSKCAYCEQFCKPDIEHYRPKGKVREDSLHSGYYWLCYEWSNLLPSCVKCNRDGGKHSAFPLISNNRVSGHPLSGAALDFTQFKANSISLLAEKPFLLHPEIDNPEIFFDFEIDPNSEGIRIIGIDSCGRAERTKEICQLNRKELKVQRYRDVVYDFIDAINAIYASYVETKDDSELCSDIKKAITTLKRKSKNDKYTHTLLRKYIVRNYANFEKIVLPFLKQKKIVEAIAKDIL